MLNSGYRFEIYKPEESKKFIGYKMLNLSEKFNTDLDFAMQNAIDNIVAYLGNKKDLLCTLQDGYEAIKHG